MCVSLSSPSAKAAASLQILGVRQTKHEGVESQPFLRKRQAQHLVADSRCAAGTDELTVHILPEAGPGWRGYSVVDRDGTSSRGLLGPARRRCHTRGLSAWRKGGVLVKNRLPMILSVTALVVSVLGATPLGRAAERVVRSVPPFANKSNYANVAGNALHLNGHAASVSGSPGTIPSSTSRGNCRPLSARWARKKPRDSRVRRVPRVPLALPRRSICRSSSAVTSTWSPRPWS